MDSSFVSALNVACAEPLPAIELSAHFNKLMEAYQKKRRAQAWLNIQVIKSLTLT